jgi:hypothetical protein
LEGFAALNREVRQGPERREHIPVLGRSELTVR